jgi:formimidoylglutamate deiminase
MKHYFFDKLLQNDGWKSNVSILTRPDGVIHSIEENATRTIAHHIKGFTLPGFQNAHSHAFQYAMAGLAEVHPTGTMSDDFWSWREAMYQLALSISPEELEAIATMLYTEMVRLGYTNVAEFHYVHHQKDGTPYENLAEMGERLISAAKTAGIGITLIPIFYQKGGFGKPPSEGQRRFISKDIDAYLQLLESSRQAARYYEHANIGIGIHSMRGVEPEIIAEVAQSANQDIPFHIHISEQLKEVEDSIAYLGKRPVEWLLENVELNDRFHLVHATHLTEAETKGIADSNANVVLCPSTEGNLGDGIFPLRKFQEANGNWSIGTDSHIGIHPLEEIRLLDYGQRLTTHQRNTMTTPDNGNSGTFSLEMATITGRKAMDNFESDFFKVGEPLNACIISEDTPLLQVCSEENLAATIVYSCDASHHSGTISHGDHMVQNAVHRNSITARDNFTNVLKSLKNR